MIMDLEVICIIDCDDCGKSVVIDPTYVTIIQNDDLVAAAICAHCERPIVESIEQDLADQMISKGVKVLSWTIDGDDLIES